MLFRDLPATASLTACLLQSAALRPGMKGISYDRHSGSHRVSMTQPAVGVNDVRSIFSAAAAEVLAGSSEHETLALSTTEISHVTVKLGALPALPR